MEAQTPLQQIEAAGAEAYRAGRSYLSNPFYASVNCPGATGEPLAEWNRKVAAWEQGWEAEEQLAGCPRKPTGMSGGAQPRPALPPRAGPR
jgi:hypothetical protein